MPRPVTLSRRDRHYASRFSYGINRKLAKQIKKAGGGAAWFEQQLRPKKIKDRKADGMRDWYPVLELTPDQLLKGEKFSAFRDLGRWTIHRRVHSKHQLHELMVEFWSNLLHVPIQSNDAGLHREAYDRMIRKYALKRFDKMLYAAVTHPAMGLFLDNATSTKDAPNENLGREVLELHTVGVGNYSERDVKNSARLLTGYQVVFYPSVDRRYNPEVHYVGKIKVMDFVHANRNPNGRPATKAYLKYLAHHPATARRIARRLCVRFVSDEPSRDLVRTVARAYTRHNTKIKPTLRALVQHPEFMKSKRSKVRTPMDDCMATIRALAPKVDRPTGDGSFANVVLYATESNGMGPYDWAGPDGYPETNPTWSTPGRVLNAMSMHRSLAAGSYRAGVTYKEHTYWLPAVLPKKFKKVINYASKKLHGRKAKKAVRKAVAIRTGIPLKTMVTADQMTEAVVQKILATLLDSPAQMIR
ncbi:MAG: DUF1800 domain-containing protein [Nocardioides sp.]